MGHPTPRLLRRSEEPILSIDRPWESGWLTYAIAAIPDPIDGDLRLYYAVFNREDPLKNVLCLARSADGRNWQKPDLGDGTNIVMRSSGNRTEWGVFMPKTVFLDEAELSPDLRWKMIYWERPDPAMPAGICLAGSPDGIHWHPCHSRPIITSANDAGSAILAHPLAKPGPRPGPVRIYQQTWKYNPNLPTERDNLKTMHRVISIWTCKSFASGWVGPTAILEPDTKDPADLQFYWLTAFHTATGYGGLLLCHHTADQTMDIQLISSRDGWNWQRELDRASLIPLGPAGRFDCGMMTALARPILWQGRALLYFNARSSVHDHQPRYPGKPQPDPAQGIGLAEFSTDLFDVGEPAKIKS